MRAHRALVASIGAGVVCLVLVVVFALRTGNGGAVGTTTLGGAIAPPVAGRELLTQANLSLRSMRGRYVIVDFFASWCGTCLSEEPQIEAFTFEHRNDPSVGFIGVDIDDSAANARAFLTRYGATWPAIADTSGQIAQSYGVANPPEMFLVDPKGRIVSSITEAVTARELDNWIAEAKAAGA